MRLANPNGSKKQLADIITKNVMKRQWLTFI
jgi:hypothetical protein